MDTVVQLQRKGSRSNGTLTIFVGYFSGTGKSYAILQAGQQPKAAGTDAVIGWLSPERWPDTQQLAKGFEMVEPSDYLALDACLKRRPQLILIDELFRENGDGSRHRKRYQDVEELLKSGIDVYTTLDIQHIESLQDTISGIFGDTVAQRIPDRVFDRAEQVLFVDIEPETLRQRLQQEKQTQRFSSYSLAQLSALREIALRRCAQRVAAYTRGIHSKNEYRSHEHILACLSAAPSNARIIRTAARMADAFQCGFTALFVETKAFARMAQQDRQRLESNMRLAQQLGASVETVYGDDVAYQIAAFARISGATKIVLGRSGIPHRALLRNTLLTERLIELIPQLDIHIIPDSAASSRPSQRQRQEARGIDVSLCDLAKSALILSLTTCVGFGFDRLGFTDANIITLYILGVLLVSMFTRGPLYSLIVSVASVLTFNFFFTEPRFSLRAYDSGYPMTFLIMFASALITGSLAGKLKSHAKRSAQVAWRTKLLFETNQSLQKAGSRREIFSTTARQLVRIFQRDVVVYRLEDDDLGQPEIFYAGGAEKESLYRGMEERQVAQWVLKNNKRAGAGTETLSQSRCIYLSVRTGQRIYGVMGIAVSDKPLDAFETGILLSVLGECALSLENQRNLEEKEASAVLAKNEQLRANLLRSISHDLRTPLTSISGNASNLLSNGQLFDEKTKMQMYADIYDDAIWLINLVENLLSVSRLEQGRMQLRLSTELMDEVVSEALRHIHRRSSLYHLQIQSSEEYILAQMDAKLIVQVLINLIDNAIKYTPPGSTIQIGWKRQEASVVVWVADNGPGISDEAKPHIFDMFYTASNRAADGRRSMGLGLALCKSIVNAHAGEITVADQSPHGTIFTFSLPAGEVELHE